MRVTYHLTTKKLKTKRSLFKENITPLNEDSDSEMPYAESDDEILKDLLQEINPENFEDLERSPTIGEFVLVKYEIPGKNSNYYVG